MAQRQSSHSFSLSFLSVSFLSAVVLLSSDVAAKAVSTSVFPNSACAGASSNNGLVGIGKVTLSSGEVETHCGCPSDNLPSFESCPTSSSGESVCNSVLDLESGQFTASCSIVACQGSSCPTTVVNTVVVDDEDCFASGKGPLGYSSVDGQNRCACATDDEEDFTICPTVDHGRASCVSVDSDFLGMAFSTKETVKCGVTCEEGYSLTSDYTCTKLAKRTYSASNSPYPTTTPATTTTKKHHHHHHHSHSHMKRDDYPMPTTTSKHHHHHSSKKHHHHKTSSTTASTTTSYPSYSATPSAKLRARAEEFAFGVDLCAADERTCSAGAYGDYTCVRLDDVTECGGCHATGDAVDCMDIPGIASAVCLRGGCVVRSCQPGYEQTSEGTCTLKE